MFRQAGPHHCPDCGYRIRAVWLTAKCRHCGTRRTPRALLPGETLATARPMERCCRQCGSDAYHWSTKDRIEAHELIYYVCLKEIDYREASHPPAPAAPAQPFKPASRHATAGTGPPPPPGDATGPRTTAEYGQHLDIVEGEVIRKRVVGSPHPGWESPFEWTPRVF